ncbi:MAG: hypothetical protein IPP71_20105 [Bacteroidetes bacterium]|nr:hypothetical protein [Bacteroidota bacterium]
MEAGCGLLYKSKILVYEWNGYVHQLNKEAYTTEVVDGPLEVKKYLDAVLMR